MLIHNSPSILRFSLAVSVVVGLLSTRADGSVISSGYSTAGGFASVGGDATVGLRFQVNGSINVTTLGVFDFGGDGLSVAHDVGLWTDSGTLLASATVPAGTGAALVDSFRYVPIAPTLLTAGSVYRVGAVFTGSADPNVEGVSYISPPQVTILDQTTTYFNSGSTLTFPTNIQGPGSNNANFQFVPEPDSSVLLTLGLLGLLAARFRPGRRMCLATG